MCQVQAIQKNYSLVRISLSHHHCQIEKTQMGQVIQCLEDQITAEQEATSPIADVVVLDGAAIVEAWLGQNI